MPSSLSHVVVFTDDIDQVLTFLAEHARLSPVQPYEAGAEGMAEMFGWPVEHARTRGAIVGTGPGTLEVVEIPEALRGRVAPGLALLAVAHRDVTKAAGVLRDAGVATRGPIEQTAPGGSLLRIVTAVSGGLPFELVEFGTAAR